jgi:hypothetical protein
MTYIGYMMKLIVISKKERWNPATFSGEKRNEKSIPGFCLSILKN